MRRNIRLKLHLLLLLMILASPDMLNGQDWARNMFKEFQHDFGTVTKPSQPVYKFEFKNIYEEDIRIRNVFSSCGCTTVSVTSRLLKTDETAYVVARFNSHIVNGPKQATLTVQFDAPFVGEVQLVVKGNAVRGTGVSLSSNQIDFGQVVSGQIAERVVQLSRSGNSRFRIENVLSTFPHVGVSLKEKYRGRDVVAYDISVRLKDSIPQGYSQGELFVVGNDNGRKIKVPIKFTAKVVAPIQVSPAILTLSPVKPGEVVTQKVVVKADLPFQITDVTCHSKAFRVRADNKMKKIHFVDVTYTGETDPGRHECFLTFRTTFGSGTEAKIKAIVDIVADSETEPAESDDSASSIDTD